MKHCTTILSTLFLTMLSANCGDYTTEPVGPETFSYQTTSNVGDLSTWTIVDNQLSAEWKDIAPITGEIERTYQLNAICGTIDATFGDRICLVDGDAVCTAGVSSCGPEDGLKNGETVTIFEIPGVALVVNTENSELHAGFAAGACTDIATDDYSYINLGLGQKDIFGLFRTNSEFSTVHHMDFAYSDAPENQISYTTGDPGGVVSGITASACDGGVRDLVIDETNDTLRMILTAAGHFIIDKPEGQGGLIAVNGQNVASIDDFAERNFGGIAFPDDRGPERINMVTGPASNGRVQILSLELSDSGVLPLDTPTFINAGPTGPTLSAALLEPKEPFASNQIVVDGSYAGGPTGIPGLFEVDAVSGDETAIIGIGASNGGKTMLFGAVVNEFEGDTNGIKGNFILIEK